jgi:hypothetical protein
MYNFLAGLFVVFFIIPFLLRGILRFLFGSNPSSSRTSQTNKNTSSQTQKNPKKKKVISKNEGEYVDYEVVKD